MEKRFSFDANRQTGTLFLVPTPIGNLQDMTFRAVDTLKQSDVIAAEDTRQTRKLLTHFAIEGPRLISYHEHNKKRMEDEILSMLASGQNVSLVTDAGTPGISDPGEELVQAAIQQGFSVVPLPGASAAITGLIASGLPTGQFSFVGFLPRDKKGRQQELKRWKSRQETLIFYEAPHRLKDSVSDMLEVFGDRKVAAARELTKRYEEFARGHLSQFREMLQTEEGRGEYVLLVSGNDEEEAESDAVWWQAMTVPQHVAALITQGLDKKEAIKQAAKERGVPKREVYNLMLDLDEA